jgi:DNA-binding response OmpR family regulator
VATVMVVEDEVALNNLLRSHLEAQSYTVIQAFDGQAALDAAESQPLDLVILDWMLPGLDGMTVCRQLRQAYLMPILMLTARSEEVDRVLGLEVGADDYLTKPYSIRELLARVRALLRRVELDTQQTVAPSSATVAAPAPAVPPTSAPTTTADEMEVEVGRVFGPLTIKTVARSVLLEGNELELTPKEYELLEMLTAQPGRAFSRDYLLRHIWDYDYSGFDRTVDAHITRLRKKLGEAGDKIVTVWGVGYRFIP